MRWIPWLTTLLQFDPRKLRMSRTSTPNAKPLSLRQSYIFPSVWLPVKDFQELGLSDRVVVSKGPVLTFFFWKFLVKLLCIWNQTSQGSREKLEQWNGGFLDLVSTHPPLLQCTHYLSDLRGRGGKQLDVPLAHHVLLLRHCQLGL